MFRGMDYYPEHWPTHMIDEDLDRIKEMNSNMVRIGEFAWHLMESEEGNFDFSYFDAVIEKAKEKGISVMFGTPTATFPAWLYKKHPSIMSVDENGNMREFGGRRQYCFNSPEYNEHAEKITKKLVKHYANEEAIVAWQIDNEFGHEGSDYCYCDNCKREFRSFLKVKYTDIDSLNEAYGTIFWGMTFNSFDEIPLPKPTITSHNPALRLDHDRFRSNSIYRFAKRQIDIVRKYKAENQKVTHNFYGGFFTKAYDQNLIAKELDFVSYDNYPVWGGLEKPLSPAELSMTLSYARGLKRSNFWIVEQLMGAQGHDIIGYLPRPNQAKLWAWQALANGCDNLLFFRYRGMTRGQEQFCYGVIDQDNTNSRKQREVRSFFEEAMEVEDILTEQIEADVALIYDYDNIRSLNIQRQSYGLVFNDEVVRVYSPFFDKNIPVDVIKYDNDFSKYKVLLVPVMQIIDNDLADRLSRFAHEGGTVLFTFRTGIKDRNNNIHFGMQSPCLVMEMVGARVEEIESLQSEVPIGKSGTGSVFRDLLVPEKAEGLIKYGDSPFDSYYALTRNNYGEGSVYYLGTGADSKVMNEIAEMIIRDQNLGVIDSDKDVEILRRKGHEIRLDHNTYEVEIRKV